MTTFTIDADNNFTVYTDPAEITNPETERFTTAKQLGKLAASWPAARLVETWNSLPGQKPVKKFTSRDKAVTRIWAAIQALVPDDGAQAHLEPPKKARTPKQTSRAKQPAAAREGSKSSTILELLKRPGGATLPEIMAATGWQAHSVRGFISGTLGKKMGLTVASTKGENGERTYSIAE
jgi:hypothetical protein